MALTLSLKLKLFLTKKSIFNLINFDYKFLILCISLTEGFSEAELYMSIGWKADILEPSYFKQESQENKSF